MPISGDGTVLLDEAVALDDAPGIERLLLVGCHDPIDAKTVVDAARTALASAAGHPEAVASLGLGCHEEFFSVAKVKP